MKKSFNGKKLLIVEFLIYFSVKNSFHLVNGIYQKKAIEKFTIPFGCYLT